MMTQISPTKPTENIEIHIDFSDGKLQVCMFVDDDKTGKIWKMSAKMEEA